ncbi:hypothetical protein CBR_g55547 [Chara braunii]|uniref:Reverse transcriptase n=1 Tax=Chara braunii TaxID=69332 RepID=A0A388MD28_CHABU|nr:hypothetical protein CBR_g55547 [Chara braunii]|eukprot:GBG92468.1 hypothetical protein CBR_g55547 [Chara braunii]
MAVITSDQWQAMLDAADESQKPFFQKLYDDVVQREREAAAAAAARAADIADQVALLRIPEANADRFQEELAAAVAALVRLRTLENLESRMTALEQRNEELQAEVISLEQSQLSASRPPNPRSAIIPTSKANTALVPRASGTVTSAGTGASSSSGSIRSSAWSRSPLSAFLRIFSLTCKHVALKVRLKLEALKGQTWRSSMQALEQHLTSLFTTPDHATWRELMKDLVDLEAKDLARRKKAPAAGGKPQRKRFGSSNQLALHEHREADDQSYADDLYLDDDLEPDSDTGCSTLVIECERNDDEKLNAFRKTASNKGPNRGSGLLSSSGKQARGVEESSVLPTAREAGQSVAGPSEEPGSDQQRALEAQTNAESKADAVQVLYAEPWEESKEVDLHAHMEHWLRLNQQRHVQGSVELTFFKLLINRRYIRVLIDSGSTTNFYSPNVIRKAGLGMKQVELQNPCRTQVGNQEVVTSTHAVKGVRITFDKDRTVTHELNFYVLDKCPFDAVIGLGWRKAHCLRTTWADNQFVELDAKGNERTVLLDETRESPVTLLSANKFCRSVRRRKEAKFVHIALVKPLHAAFSTSEGNSTSTTSTSIPPTSTVNDQSISDPNTSKPVVITVNSRSDFLSPDEDDPPPEIPANIRLLLDRFPEVLAEPRGVPERPVKHKIEIVEGSVPPKGCVYRMGQGELEELRRQIDDMIDCGWIRPSESEFGAPVLFVPKKGGKLQMCIDYRGLNRITRKNAYPLPRIDDLLDAVGGCKVFSKITLKSGYHQIEVDPSDQHKTAFKTRDGLYEFIVMPFGLTNAPATFQCLMDKVLRHQLNKFVVVYLDDILIFSKSMDEHVKHLEEVLQVLKDAQLHLNLEKSEFARDSVSYLGHRLSANGLEPEATKVEVIQNWPQPANVRELRSFLGLASYYRKFVPRFSTIAHPLSRLTSKNVTYAWCEKCESAFQALKEALVSHHVLRIADPNLTFVVTTDASQFGIGAVLQQDDGDGLRPLEYYSKRMPSHKVATSTYMRELYALREALAHWKHYLLGRHFKVYSDHQTLQWIQTQFELSPTSTRWLHDIDVYNFELKHKKGCYNRVADALSRHPEYLTCLVGSYDLRRKLKEDLIEHTAKDPDLNPILEQLKADPNSQPDFHECEGLVFRRYGKFDRLCVPNHAPLRTHFLDLVHGRGGHFGFEKTYGSLLQQFDWPGMKGSAQKFIAECQVCQKIKVHRHKPYGLLRPLPIPDGPGESISINFTDMGKVSEAGNSQVMVIVDRFSKFLNLIPLPPHAPIELVIEEFHQQYILQSGVPKTIVSNRDTRFISKDWKDFTSQIYDIKLNRTSGRHPEANGLAEEISQTVIQLLRALIVLDQNTRDKELHKVKGLYNNSIHSATGVTPNQLQYGWSMRNPLSYLFPERSPGLMPGMPGYNAKYARLLKTVTAVMNKRQHAMIKHANKLRKEEKIQSRAATCVTVCDCSFLVVTKEHFLALYKHKYTTHYSQAVRFLQLKVPLFANVASSRIRLFAHHFSATSYARGHVFFLDSGMKLFFIRNGTCNLCYPVNDSGLRLNTAKRNLEHKGITYRIIAVLGVGHFFGESSLFPEERFGGIIHTRSKLSTFVIHKRDFISHADAETVDALRTASTFRLGYYLGRQGMSEPSRVLTLRASLGGADTTNVQSPRSHFPTASASQRVGAGDPDMPVSSSDLPARIRRRIEQESHQSSQKAGSRPRTASSRLSMRLPLQTTTPLRSGQMSRMQTPVTARRRLAKQTRAAAHSPLSAPIDSFPDEVANTDGAGAEAGGGANAPSDIKRAFITDENTPLHNQVVSSSENVDVGGLNTSNVNTTASDTGLINSEGSIKGTLHQSKPKKKVTLLLNEDEKGRQTTGISPFVSGSAGEGERPKDETTSKPPQSYLRDGHSQMAVASNTVGSIRPNQLSHSIHARAGVQQQSPQLAHGEGDVDDIRQDALLVAEQPTDVLVPHEEGRYGARRPRVGRLSRASKGLVRGPQQSTTSMRRPTKRSMPAPRSISAPGWNPQAKLPAKSGPALGQDRPRTALGFSVAAAASPEPVPSPASPRVLRKKLGKLSRLSPLLQQRRLEGEHHNRNKQFRTAEASSGATATEVSLKPVLVKSADVIHSKLDALKCLELLRLSPTAPVATVVFGTGPLRKETGSPTDKEQPKENKLFSQQEFKRRYSRYRSINYSEDVLIRKAQHEADKEKNLKRRKSSAVSEEASLPLPSSSRKRQHVRTEFDMDEDVQWDWSELITGQKQANRRLSVAKAEDASGGSTTANQMGNQPAAGEPNNAQGRRGSRLLRRRASSSLSSLAKFALQLSSSKRDAPQAARILSPAQRRSLSATNESPTIAEDTLNDKIVQTRGQRLSNLLSLANWSSLYPPFSDPLSETLQGMKKADERSAKGLRSSRVTMDDHDDGGGARREGGGRLRRDDAYFECR